ncbi:glycosyltransferase family protein [[Clostridium] polysaccharolyticum]|uniref:Uncharacterized protein n=1 Tax=[Clostridium] polysaccharolyticum TaxID=29364 RepID=A0A1H9ZC38_9FIRM|nr:hypothetical protein [[Clostridium] polysaccharolyticum]SES79031.1 hypothetical protein SAMN04487772_103119 [[Clostridium] polysaccharolyticum]
MKRILFVTDKNVLTTSGELRLIKNRAEVLYQKYGVSTDFLALQKAGRIHSDAREKIQAGGSMKIIPYSLKNPIKAMVAFASMKKSVAKELEKGEYWAVVYSGIGMSRVTKAIKKKFGIFSIVDMHGSQEDIIEAGRNGTFLRRMFLQFLYRFDVSCLKNAFPYMDGCFAVTEALEMYIRKKYPVNSQIAFYHVPCATMSYAPSEKEYESNREKYRLKYGIKEDEIVFIYSGGVSSWQCIEETIELYRKIEKQIKRKTRMLIFSHNIKEINKLITSEDSIITDSYTADELKKALNAGDYAFMLRKDCVTNNVAFPNKFLEYVQSGMKMIATPHVHDIAKQIEQNKAGYLYNFEEDISMLLKYVEENFGADPDYAIINKILRYNSFEERLQELVSDL